LLPPDTHIIIPAGRLYFGRAGLLPAELHQLTLAHALFLQSPRAGLGAKQDWVCLGLFFAIQNRKIHQNLHKSLISLT